MKRSMALKVILASLFLSYGQSNASNDYESISLNTYNNLRGVIQPGSCCQPEIKEFEAADFDNIFPAPNPVSSVVGKITMQFPGDPFTCSGTGTIIGHLLDGRFEGITAKHNFYKSGCFFDTKVERAFITLGQSVLGPNIDNHGTINITSLIPDPHRDVALFRGTLQEIGDVRYVNRITNGLRNIAHNLLQDREGFSMVHHPASTLQQRINQGILASTDRETFCFSDRIRDLGHYGMDTLPGSSGAALFNNNEIVGVHISGNKSSRHVIRYNNRDYPVSDGDGNNAELFNLDYVDMLRRLNEEII